MKNGKKVCVQYSDLKLDIRVPDDFDAEKLENKIRDDYVDLLQDHIRMGYYFLQAYAAIDFRKYRREGDQTMKYKGFTDFCMKVGKCSRKKIYMCMRVLSAFGRRDEDGCLLPELVEKAAGRSFSVLAEIAEYPDLLGELPRGASTREARAVVKSATNKKQDTSPDVAAINCDLKLSPSGFDLSSWPGKDRSTYEPHLGSLAALVKIWNSQGYDVGLTFTQRKRRQKDDPSKPRTMDVIKQDARQMSLSDLPLPDAPEPEANIQLERYCVMELYKMFDSLLGTASDEAVCDTFRHMCSQSYGRVGDAVECHFCGEPSPGVVVKCVKGSFAPVSIGIDRLCDLWREICGIKKKTRKKKG